MHYNLRGPISVRQHPWDGFTVRVSDNARKMTVFFGAPDPDRDGGTIWGGTGFLALHREDGIPDMGFPYLVTARHVAERVSPDAGIVVRVNNKDGKTSVPMLLDEIHWFYHPDRSVDIAITPAYLDPKDFDVGYYTLADRVRPETSEYRVSYGDDIAIVGLFHWHSGRQRNVPIVHCGTIALLPDPDEKVLIKNRTTGLVDEVEVYLVEAQTFEGLSGAPVFQREPVALKGLGIPDHNGGPAMVLSGMQMLGVYTGAWDGPPSEAVAADRKWKPDRRVPAGMGLVVPIERVMEVIMNDPALKKRRADAIEKKRSESAAVTDSALPSTDANPKHREDFNSLVGAAAQKRERED